MDIRAIQKTSLIDFSEKIASTVFVFGCNFRCPFCHNVGLVFEKNEFQKLKEQDVLNLIKQRANVIDGVCISGGEPTLQKDLPEFCKKIKEMKKLIKLDTNGSNPDVVQELIEKKLVDYIAIDIKSSPEKYGKASGVKADMEAIQKTIDFVRASGIEYEFRTTVVPTLIEEEDIEEIGKWLKGAKKYYLQNFRSQRTLDESFQKIIPYSEEKMKLFLEKAKPFFESCAVR